MRVFSSDVTVLGSGEGADVIVRGAASRALAVVRGWNGFAAIPHAEGVQVNGEPLARWRPLANGDVLRVGESAYRFHSRPLVAS